MSDCKSLLITVGTTGFNDLIRTVCSEAFICELKAFGYQSIYIQFGSSKEFCNQSIFEKYNVCTIYDNDTIDYSSYI